MSKVHVRLTAEHIEAAPEGNKATAMDRAISEAMGRDDIHVGFDSWHRGKESERHGLPRVASDWIKAVALGKQAPTEIEFDMEANPQWPG